jgi:methyl-accepting chemotaxis protein
MNISTLVIFGTTLLSAVFLTRRIVSRSHESIVKLKEVAADVAGQTVILSEASVELQESSAVQTKAVLESQASLTEISEFVNQTRTVAQISSEASDNTVQIISEGMNKLNQMKLAMEDISATSDQLQELVQLIDDIGRETEVINDIVFKTQLLSFNASIEAARAGDAGAGFTVVAAEIADLASTSGEAADTITELILNSVVKVEGIVATINTKVNSGELAQSATSESFTQVNSSILDLNIKMKQIASATQQQAKGISQTIRLIGSLAESASKNSSTAQYQMSNVGIIRENSENLSSIESHFQKEFGSAS